MIDQGGVVCRCKTLDALGNDWLPSTHCHRAADNTPAPPAFAPPPPPPGFYPHILRVEAPVKYQAVAGGAMRVESDPAQIKFFERGLGRVWLHPASVCFKAGSYSSGEGLGLCVGGGWGG